MEVTLSHRLEQAVAEVRPDNAAQYSPVSVMRSPPEGERHTCDPLNSDQWAEAGEGQTPDSLTLMSCPVVAACYVDASP